MNTIPIKAGNTKLTTHITKVADRIPIELFETNINKNSATEPRTPISVIAIVGITEITKSIVEVRIIELTYDTSTLKTCKSIKNCVVNIIYLATEYNKTSNKSDDV